VDDPLCVLLLPRPLERFILRDQAEDLLRALGVVAVDPPRVPYGAYGRLPEPLAAGLAARTGRRLVRALRRRRGTPRAVVIFHPLQYPIARSVLAEAGAGCELWYGRWDRYEQAYDAPLRMRERLEALHADAAAASSLTFVASERLAELERDAGREATVVGLAAGDFPAPDPRGTVVALSLGHLGWRTDWVLLRGVAERLGDRLVLLLVGEWHEDEAAGDEDFAACRSHPSLVWLGRRSDEEAARLLLCADVGVVPFERSTFNDPALPYRILKYARLGRRTVMQELPGARTWAHAVTFADGPQAFADALLAHAGDRERPDLELRGWALEQTAPSVNAPLWARLRQLGVEVGRVDSQ
jgi:glycosyltransferase involved in cell wall biosynthesis